jgi:hypothetical protein
MDSLESRCSALNGSAQWRWLKTIEVFKEQGESRPLKMFPSAVTPPQDDEQVEQVLVNGVRMERTRRFGECFLGLEPRQDRAPLGRHPGAPSLGRRSVLCNLPAEVVAATPAAALAIMPVAVPPAIPVPAALTVVLRVRVIVAIPDADKRPASRNPVAVRVVPGHPLIPRPRTGRNIGRRSADIYTPVGCLRRRCRQAQSTRNYRCTQHPVRHAFHQNPPSHLTRAFRVTPSNETPVREEPDRKDRIRSGCLGRLASCRLPLAGYVLIKHSFFRRLRAYPEK